MITRLTTLAAGVALTALVALPVLAPSTALSQQPPAAPQAQGNETLIIQLKSGQVVIELLPQLAPRHVERIKTLVGQGFYDGLKFHRVMAGFMAQTGDPNGDGSGGSTLPNLQAEFTRYPFRRGTVGMARTNEPNTANSQFFICYNDQGCLGLTGSYTVWGQVISGMEHVDKIRIGTGDNGAVLGNPDTMVKVTLGARVVR